MENQQVEKKKVRRAVVTRLILLWSTKPVTASFRHGAGARMELAEQVRPVTSVDEYDTALMIHTDLGSTEDVGRVGHGHRTVEDLMRHRGLTWDVEENDNG